MRSLRFRYRAAAADGTRCDGQLQADTAQGAAAELVARGLYVLSVRPVNLLSHYGKRVPVREQMLGLKALASLLRSRMPVARVIRLLPEVAPRSWEGTCAELSTRLREGAALSTSLEQCQTTLSPSAIALIKAGEAVGSLEQGVRLAAHDLEEYVNTRDALRGALAYPALLGVATVAVGFLLTIVVLPRFATTMSDAGVALPPITVAVLNVSRALQLAIAPTLIGALLLAAGLRLWMSRPGAREAWAGWLIRMPLLGEFRFAHSSGRLCRSLGIMLKSGLPVGTSLRHAAAATGDACIVARAARAQNHLLRGESLHLALRGQQCLSETALRLVRAGEESGDVGGMLEFAGTLEGARAIKMLQRGTRMIEPLMIIALGGVVAIIAMALLQALYSMRPGA